MFVHWCMCGVYVYLSSSYIFISMQICFFFLNVFSFLYAAHKRRTHTIHKLFVVCLRFNSQLCMKITYNIYFTFKIKFKKKKKSFFSVLFILFVLCTPSEKKNSGIVSYKHPHTSPHIHRWSVKSHFFAIPNISTLNQNWS